MAATRITKQDLGSTVFAAPAVVLDIAANVASGTSGQAIQTNAHIIAFDTTAPSTQASADAAAVGTAAVAARRDHKHAMPTIPAAAAGGTPALTLSTSNSAGSASTFIRTDDTLLAFDATAPSTQAFGDSAAVGTATVAARRDHKHAMMANPAGGTAVWSEAPSGTINGSNTDFTIAHTPASGTLRVYKNGIRQQAGAGNDFTLATATITFLAGNIPATGDILLADYLY
jgi:hypothetical protein